MKKKIIFALGVLTLAAAIPFSAMSQTRDEREPRPERVFRLPSHDAGAHVVYLGRARDPRTQREVEGYAIVHDRREQQVRSVGPSATRRQNACYAFLANGARWKATESYLFDPSNVRGLDGATLQGLLASGAEEWDSRVPFEIFGSETTGEIDGAEVAAPDGKNEVFFADVSSPGAIAVTTVWGIWSGPVYQRQIVEWDMVFDDQDFDWSAEAAGVADKMDFLNIAVHELGHAAGMGHPSDSCAQESMYRFAEEGEMKKRDLHTGDINGIKALYK